MTRSAFGQSNASKRFTHTHERTPSAPPTLRRTQSRAPLEKGPVRQSSRERKGSVSLASALQRLLLKEPARLEEIAKTICDAAAAGDLSAARLLFERLDGHKPSGFFSVHVDASDRRTAVSISPQVLGEISEARRRYEETKSCRQLPTT